MHRIEKLIEKLCPEGVEYKMLGEICEFQNGYSFKNSEFKTNGTPILRITNIQNSRVNTNNLVCFDLKDSTKNLDNFLVKKNDIVIAMSGATTGKIGINNLDIIFYLNQRVGKFIPNTKELLNKYLFYLLQKKTEYFYTKSGGGAQPNLSTKDIKKTIIPVPPLAIQEEIVHILDKFTALEAALETELEAELEARKKQYEYYRDELFSFDDEVEWKTLGELGDFIRGNGLQKKDFTENGTGCIHYGQIYTYYHLFANKTKTFVSPELAKKLKKAKKNDLIVATTSENAEDLCKAVAWLGNSDIAISGDSCIYRHTMNPKFVAYYFQSKRFFDYKKKYITGTKVLRVSAKNLAKIPIPVPPLAEQERIVNILDRFDQLVNDISTGLPAEIAARRQQYEHYRNQLLTFKPLPHDHV